MSAWNSASASIASFPPGASAAQATATAKSRLPTFTQKNLFISPPILISPKNVTANLSPPRHRASLKSLPLIRPNLRNLRPLLILGLNISFRFAESPLRLSPLIHCGFQSNEFQAHHPHPQPPHHLLGRPGLLPRPPSGRRYHLHRSPNLRRKHPHLRRRHRNPPLLHGHRQPLPKPQSQTHP